MSLYSPRFNVLRRAVMSEFDREAPALVEQPRAAEVYFSPEGVVEISEGLNAMIEAAKDSDAVRPWRRNIHRVVHEYDPNGVDPENNQLGVIVERRVHIPDPEGFDTTVWRTYVDSDKTLFYEWRVSFTESGDRVVTLESPVDIGKGDIAGATNRARAGVVIHGRRLQDFTTRDDGRLLIRSADFTLGPTGYRVAGPETRGEATVGQVAFLRSNLGQAELVAPFTAESATVSVASVAPDFGRARLVDAYRYQYGAGQLAQ
jgi:hypothetical protein